MKYCGSLWNFIVFCGIILSEDEASKGTVERWQKPSVEWVSVPGIMNLCLSMREGERCS